MVFMEFRSKFAKIWGNSWISSQAHRAFTSGFPMSSMGGGVGWGGGVDIFWNSAMLRDLYVRFKY